MLAYSESSGFAIISVSMSKEKYWFSKKCYGWGWGLPVTWQGWAVLVLYLGLIAGGSIYFVNDGDPFWPRGAVLLAWVFFCSALLTVVCYKKGPKPSWTWGNKSD